jgi:predicted nucleic acid-binding protein
VRDVVLDASVVLKWFHSQGEHNVDAARAVRVQFEAGSLRVLAPPLLWLEVLNVAARRWSWEQALLEKLAVTLPQLGFELIEPQLAGVARWTAAGLTAYDAAYVALAEQAGAKVITDDVEIAQHAPQLASALGSWNGADE